MFYIKSPFNFSTCAPVISLISITLLPSCSTISENIGTGITKITKRPGSFEKDKEMVVVAPQREVGDEVNINIESATEISSNSRKTAAGLVPAGLVDKAAGYLVDQLEKGVESAAGNYSVVYSGSYIGDDLENTRGFDLTRKIGKSEDDAMRMRLNFRRSGQGAYTLGLHNIALSKSKSAIPFWDKDVDMVVKVELGVLDPEKNAMISVVNTEFVVKGVELGSNKPFDNQQCRTTWFRFPKYQSTTVPYKVTVTIQETSDFYKVAEKGKSLVGEKKKDWAESLAKTLSGES